MPRTHVENFAALRTKLERAHSKESIDAFIDSCEKGAPPTSADPLFRALAVTVDGLGSELRKIHPKRK